MNWSELNEQGLGKYISSDKYGLSTFTLKIIAVVLMMTDHFALLFCGNHKIIYEVLRSGGRLSFPIFCFVLVEGFFYTSDRLRHALRLGAFALISEAPYDMMYGSFFDLRRQNVLFTLLIGFLTIWALDYIRGLNKDSAKRMSDYSKMEILNAFLRMTAMVSGLAVSYFLNTSYSYAGVMLMICFYVFRKHHIGKLLSNMIFNMGMFGFTIQWWGILSAIPIALYNEKPGSGKFKYFFYWFYPLHLLVLIIIKKYLYLFL